MTKDELLGALESLDVPSRIPAIEKALLEVVGGLLRLDGYKVTEILLPEDNVDLVGSIEDERGRFSIGVQTKIMSGAPVTLPFVRRDIGQALAFGVDRVLFVTNARLSSEAQKELGRGFPAQLEIVEFEHLKRWIQKLEEPESSSGALVAIRSAFSRQLAELVAKTPDYLEQIEWRELEYVLYEILKGIGFEAELTPPSKDGGKDIILKCWRNGARRSYVVEIKHWKDKGVGRSVVCDFLRVIVNEKHESGLLVATGGFTANAFEQLTEIERQRLKAGTGTKVIAFCQTFVRARGGIFSPPSLPEILFEGTE